MKLILLVALFAFCLTLTVKFQEPEPTFSAKFVGYRKNGNKYQSCEMISQEETQIHRLVNNEGDFTKKTADVHVQVMPQMMEHLADASGNPEIVEVFGLDQAKITLKVQELCQSTFNSPKGSEKDAENDEVIEIVKSGPSANRIDITYMGDGYTQQEKQKHLDDMKRLHTDMFTGKTFTPYLPLFNVWQVYRPSAESGVGTHGRARNTAYRLYRQGTELRGLFPGNPSGIRQACSRTGPRACDFPTVIGNDAYYGGLGGEFAISTSSETSGTKVLRHEFGHNFGGIGEEYDSPGRGAYFGHNFASSVSDAQSKWAKWLSANPVKAQDSANRINAYPWYDLAKGPLSLPFTSNGQYKRAFLRFTVSGCETQESLIVTLDGQKLNWTTTQILDRGFHEFRLPPFTSGSHVLRFQQGTAPRGHIRQVCNVGLLEYQNDDQYNWDNSFISAYPLYGGQSRIGFRSQNERCLMRNMTSVEFCEVCKENLWLRFFSRMNAIDEVKVNQEGDKVSVEAVFVKIGQFRTPRIEGENFEIKWTRGGRPVPELDGKHQWSMADARGSWTVNAKFVTKEVRMDPRNVLSFSRSFSIN